MGLDFSWRLSSLGSLPVFRTLTLLFTPLIVFADVTTDYLQQYVGRWVGEFTIHSAATGYSEVFPVEQRYWMEGGKLHGLSVSETDRGIQTASSVTFIQDGKFRSEVKRGETKEVYLGKIHDSGLVWISEDLARATDYQLKEAFVVEEGELWLTTEGFDTFIYKEGLAHLVYKGRLKKVPEEEEEKSE